MPWRETCRMDEKLDFVLAWHRGDAPMTALCAAYGISRKTGYKWLGRYREGGEAGLAERSRAPRRHGRAMAPEVAAAIVALRREYPHWGPRKLRAVLMREDPGVVWPAASTMGDLLRAEGLVPRRRVRRRLPSPERPFRAAEGPNDVWCIDFKGWFRTGDGARCDPLTISDLWSRYLLAVVIVPPRTDPVAAAVEAVFRRYGMPLALRSDNGTPFASTAAGGLSRLSAQWAKAGIALERIEPGRPQQNGRHERMHRTLKAETAKPPAASVAAQQARFDRFRDAFNAVRPHEALGQVPPATLYRPSPRQWREPEEPVYDPSHAVRRVRPNGCIKWGGAELFVSEALIGESVGIAEIETGDWIARFAGTDLGLFDRQSGKLRPYPAARPGRRVRKRTENTVTHVTGP